MKTLFDNSAKARVADPVQSHMAADRVNEGDNIKSQRTTVLRWLKELQPCAASEIDWKRDHTGWLTNPKGIAHRRMRELETMGLVERKKKDDNGKNLKEMICSLTDKGEQWLRNR